VNKKVCQVNPMKSYTAAQKSCFARQNY